MDRKKLQDQIDEARRVTVKVEALIVELESELAKKPELRHGDYGYWNTGEPWLVLLSNNILESFGKSRGAGMKASMMPIEQLTILGNIFDDLKAMGKDLPEFEVGCNDGGNRKVEFKFHDNGMGMYICIRNARGGIDANINIPAKETLLNLRIMEATLKRAK